MQNELLNEGQTTKEAVDLVTETPVIVTIETPARTLFQRLGVKLGWHKEVITFELLPIKTGVMFRIAAIIKNLPDNIVKDRIEGEDILPTAFLPYFHSHYRELIDIVAYGLTNSKKEPTDSLRELIEQEFDMPTMLRVLDIIVHQLRLTNFLSFIALAKGNLNVLPKASRD